MSARKPRPAADHDNDDHHDTPFTLHAPRARVPSRKRQKLAAHPEHAKDFSLGPDIVQPNPFYQAPLSTTHHLVKPMGKWETMARYRKFTIKGAEFQVGDTICVSNHRRLDPWLARVLEVRAHDPSHVYLRIYWLYRPHELPGGRQPHHAEGELIASNHMDIIDALTVEDKDTLMYWDEDFEKPFPTTDDLFWRQTFDVTKPKGHKLSPLRTICLDKAPCNPDQSVVQCPSCSEWLHSRCLENKAVRDAQAAFESNNNRPKSSRKSMAKNNLFTARLATEEKSAITYLTVTKHAPGEEDEHHNVDIHCLVCNALIEAAVSGLQTAENVLNATAPSASAANPSKSKEKKNSSVKTEPTDADSVIGPLQGSQHATTEPRKKQRGRPRKHKPALAQTQPVQEDPAAALAHPLLHPHPTAPASTTAPTPSPFTSTTPPTTDSVIHFGLHSIRKLLWPSTAQ
ncbi:hypothetical protein ACEQ8H_008423 [Pleosporales sp. CAS-2024a]